MPSIRGRRNQDSLHQVKANELIGHQAAYQMYRTGTSDEFIAWITQNQARLSPKALANSLNWLSSSCAKHKKTNNCDASVIVNEFRLDQMIYKVSAFEFHLFLKEIPKLQLNSDQKALLQTKLCSEGTIKKLLACSPTWVLESLKALDDLGIKGLEQHLPWHKVSFLFQAMKIDQKSESLWHMSNLGFTKAQLATVLDGQTLEKIAQQDTKRAKMRAIFALANLGLPKEFAEPILSKAVLLETLGAAKGNELVKIVESFLSLGCDQDIMALFIKPSFYDVVKFNTSLPEQVRFIQCLAEVNLDVTTLLTDEFIELARHTCNKKEKLILAKMGADIDVDDESSSASSSSHENLCQQRNPSENEFVGRTAVKKAWADEQDDGDEVNLEEKYNWRFV